ncbi:MAG: hypothetical protein BRC22_01770 [Parcubacteria group bacterium QH_9_35_7]|nr:MAG: hypothetical protein BRC22_01770 [Parcubacteria group bacterium QH_9_35_7]
MNTRKLFVFGFFVALLAFPSFSQAKEFVDASVSEAAYQLHREVGWGDGCIESFKKVPCQERPPTWGPAASKFKNLLHKKMEQQLNSYIKQVEFGEKADLSIIDKQIQKLDEFKQEIHASELEEPTDKYRYVNRIGSIQRDLKGQKKIVRHVEDSLTQKQQELKTKNQKLEELKQEKDKLESKLANLKQEKKKAGKETKAESKEASSSVFTWKQSTFVFAVLFVLSLLFIWFRRPENNSEEFKSELEKKKEELEDAEEELEEVKNKKAHTEDELKVEKDKKQELEGELTEAHSKLERAEEKRKELETQLQEQKEEIDRLQQQTKKREEKIQNLKQRLEKAPELVEKLRHAKTRIQELENKETNSADPSPQPNLHEESELEEETSDLREKTADTAVAKINDKESNSPNIHHLNKIQESSREREETNEDMGDFHAHQEDVKHNIEPIGEGTSAPEEQPPKDYDSPDGTNPGPPNPEESEEKNTKGQWEE